MGSNNKAYLRMGVHLAGNNMADPRVNSRKNKALFRRSSQLPLLVFEVTNTVENMEDVLSNATRIVCVGSGARMPSVILQSGGNRLLLQPNSHVLVITISSHFSGRNIQVMDEANKGDFGLQ